MNQNAAQAIALMRYAYFRINPALCFANHQVLVPQLS
jgi:hypothetical protein